MQEEIWLHDRRKIYPDWGQIWLDHAENKRRDHASDYAKRRDSELTYKKEYRQRPEVKAAHAKRRRDERKNPAERVRHNLSKRLWEVMKGQSLTNYQSILGYLGCSPLELRRHLEQQFKRGMTWENYGTRWHVDHIIPCASFDHDDLNQIAQCWHWTNLRPLKAAENISKSDTITLPQMSLRLERCA